MEFLARFHPQVVHFPIAMFIVYAVLEIIGAFVKKDFISKAAYLCLFLGVLGAVAAVLTGNAAEDAVRQLIKQGAAIPKGAIGQHEDAATWTLWYFTGLLFLRTYFVVKKKFKGSIKYMFAVLAIAGSAMVYRTGLLGGRLVYKYGAGTDIIKTEIKK